MFLDDFKKRNYHPERNLDVTFSPLAEFGTDQRRGTRHQRGHSQIASGFFDSFFGHNDKFFLYKEEIYEESKVLSIPLGIIRVRIFLGGNG